MIFLVVHDVELGFRERRREPCLTILMRVTISLTPSSADRSRCGEYHKHTGVKFQRFPPGVVSGFPNITPIFSRLVVKMQQVALEIREVSFQRCTTS